MEGKCKMLQLFITGVKPNSGKTFVTAGLAATMQSLGYTSAVYLPVQTGAMEQNGYIQAPDLVYIKKADSNIKTYCSYLLKSTDLPLFAAAAEDVLIEKDVIFEDYLSISERYECFIVNGVSGLSTPLSKNFLEEDLIKTLDIPLLIVASPLDSSFNEILLTINNAISKNIQLRGVILNDCPFKTGDVNIKNLPRMIEEYSNTRVLGLIPHIHDMRNFKPEDLISTILSGVDIESVFDVKIAKLRM